MIGVDDRLSRCGLCFGIVKKQNHIVIERALIGFERQRIIALLRDDLCAAMVRSPVERHLSVTMVPFKVSTLSNFGTVVISFDWASVATCANISRCSEPHVLTMCKADLPPTRSNERRAQNLAINSHHALHLLGELGQKPLTMHRETDPGPVRETVG
jgi:hypothetical protein